MDRVFISYCRSDADFVGKLLQDLNEYRVQVWLDERDISIGTDWPKEIQQALKDSTKCLLVLSPDSVKSRWVQNEITYAQNMKKIVVPVLLRDCDIPIQLQTVQYIDFRQTAYDQDRYNEALRRLLKALQPLTSEILELESELRPIPDLFIKTFSPFRKRTLSVMQE